MKILLLLLVVGAIGVHAQAQRLNSQALCGACSYTVTKILTALEGNPSLKDDIPGLRSAAEALADGQNILRIKTIFSGWVKVLETIFSEEKNLNSRVLYRRLCIDTDVCTARDL